MRAARKTLLITATMLALLVSAAIVGAAGSVPVPLRSAIIVKSLSYERGFAARDGSAVLAVVAAKSGSSARDGREVAALLTKLLTSSKVAGRKVRVVQLTHESSAKTVSELARQRAEVVYVGAGLESIIKEVPAKESGIARILVCARGADVGHGCTFGVELAGQKPRLVLDLRQANRAGLRFEPAFLKLARIVR
jgi:hypothetical protein